MSFSKLATAVGLLASASSVAAHGYVSGIVADGVYYGGFLPDTYNYMSTIPASVGWTEKATDNGYVAPDAYASGDIICHKNATNAQAYGSVAAGGTVEFQWNTWPDSHHGPVLTYIADCGGDCTTVDKTTLMWTKIDAVGLVDDTTAPGTWASDELISGNLSWTSNIPSDLAAGKYVLRHEIIALHGAESSDGAQNYPFCVNVEVTGSGTTSLPAGTAGESLYTETEAGILVNIYTAPITYTIPGPALWSAASTGAAGGSAATGSAAAVAATSAAASAATSAAAEATTAAAVAATTEAAAVSAPATTAAAAVPTTFATSVAAVATTEAAPAATSAAAYTGGDDECDA